jgi:hypothetical protein
MLRVATQSSGTGTSAAAAGHSIAQTAQISPPRVSFIFSRFWKKFNLHIYFILLFYVLFYLPA